MRQWDFRESVRTTEWSREEESDGWTVFVLRDWRAVLSLLCNFCDIIFSSFETPLLHSRLQIVCTNTSVEVNSIFWMKHKGVCCSLTKYFPAVIEFQEWVPCQRDIVEMQNMRHSFRKGWPQSRKDTVSSPETLIWSYPNNSLSGSWNKWIFIKRPQRAESMSIASTQYRCVKSMVTRPDDSVDIVSISLGPELI